VLTNEFTVVSEGRTFELLRDEAGFAIRFIVVDDFDPFRRTVRLSHGRSLLLNRDTIPGYMDLIEVRHEWGARSRSVAPERDKRLSTGHASCDFTIFKAGSSQSSGTRDKIPFVDESGDRSSS